MKENSVSLSRNITCIVISVAMLCVLTMLVLYMPDACKLDKELLSTIKSFLEPYPQYIPLFFSEFGTAGHMLWPQITVAAVLISHQKYLKAFLFVLFTQGAFHLNALMKNYICRERPCGDAYPGFSFPSCHATTIMCFLGIVIYLVLQYVRNTFWRYTLVTIFGLYIIMSCLSRFWLGVHFPIDVLAGLFLGFTLVNLYIIIDKISLR